MPPETPVTTADPAMTAPTPPAGFQGGPGDPISAPGKAAPAAGTGTPPQTAPAPKEIYLGGKKFSSMEELATYTQELQTKAAVADQIRGVVNPAEPQADPEAEMAELLYSDPTKATRLIKEKAVNEAVQIIEQRNAAKNVRQEFFAANKDLQGHEDLVDLYYSKLQKELANLPIEAATSKLANAVRARVASIRGERQATEELTNRNPVVIGSGTTAPNATVSSQAPVSFQDQMKQWQSKRSKK